MANSGKKPAEVRRRVVTGYEKEALSQGVVGTGKPNDQRNKPTPPAPKPQRRGNRAT